MQDTEKELLTVAKELEGKLTDDKIAFFEMFVTSNEIYVGIEILLQQIYEEDVVLSKKSYSILEKVIRGKKIFDKSLHEGLKLIKYN